MIFIAIGSEILPGDNRPLRGRRERATMIPMTTKTTWALVGAAVGLSSVTWAVLARQAEPGQPQDQLKGPVKVFLLAGQSNMEGHGGVRTLDRLGDHPTHGYLLRKIKRDDGSFVVRDDVVVSYQKAKRESDRHVSNCCGHYQGSARVYCLVGYSLAAAMKPLLSTQHEQP